MCHPIFLLGTKSQKQRNLIWKTEAALQGKGKLQWQKPGWSSGCGCLLGTPPLMRVPPTPQMVKHHEAFCGVLLPNGPGQPSGSLCGALHLRPGRGCGPRPPRPLTFPYKGKWRYCTLKQLSTKIAFSQTQERLGCWVPHPSVPHPSVSQRERDRSGAHS